MPRAERHPGPARLAGPSDTAAATDYQSLKPAILPHEASLTEPPTPTQPRAVGQPELVHGNVRDGYDGFLRRVGHADALVDAIEYSLLGPGKRLRPLLTILACEAVGGSVEQALPAGCHHQPPPP